MFMADQDCKASILSANKSHARSKGGGGNGGPLKNHKATKSAFNAGLLSARQRNAIKMAFRWRSDDDPLLVLTKKKTVVRIVPPLQSFLNK